MDWKLLWKSGWRALKWQFISWLAIVVISIMGVYSLIASDQYPWRFRIMLIVAWFILWLIFYKIDLNKKKQDEKDAQQKFN